MSAGPSIERQSTAGFRPAEIAGRLLGAGFAFPCAYCERMWFAVEAGSDTCAPMLPPGASCAGPIAGEAFPFYKGPLTRGWLADHCFRCGEEASKHVEPLKARGVYLGVCDKHVPTLERLIPAETLRRR